MTVKELRELLEKVEDQSLNVRVGGPVSDPLVTTAKVVTYNPEPRPAPEETYLILG
jgi:hypothetical protein